MGRRPTNEESEIKKRKRNRFQRFQLEPRNTVKKQPAFSEYKICTDVCVKFASLSLSHSSLSVPLLPSVSSTSKFVDLVCLMCSFFFCIIF